MRIAIAVAAAIAATSVSFAVATAANDQPVAQTSAKVGKADRAMIKQLRSINRGINQLGKAIGTSEFNGLRGEVHDIASDTEDMNRTLGRGVAGRTVMRVLDDICNNTAEFSFDC